MRAIGAEPPFAASQPLSIETVTLDDPGPMELEVKVAGAGLCHSDLSVINGNRGREAPMVMGHEGSGVVTQVGSAITDVSVGDHVVFQFSVSCGRCRACLSGRPNICEAAPAARSKGELISGGRRIRDAEGHTIRHQSGISCFAEYAVVHRGSVVVIDQDIPLSVAAVFGCAVMTGVGSVVNTAKVKPGESVAIFGLGGVGLSALMGARIAGARPLIAVDLEDAKLAKATELGATHAFNATDPDLIAKITSLTAGGVDHAIDLAGAIPALKAAYAVTVRGGQVITAGLAPFGAEFAFEQGDLVSNEKSILGSYMGSCVPVRDVPRYLSLMQAGVLQVEQLIDREIGFDDLNAGFDQLASGSALRQILIPGGGSNSSDKET